MKIVCISDTHLAHVKHDLKIPDGDMIIHAGDSTSMGKAYEISQFSEWFVALPHKHKIFVAGNHDFLFESNPSAALQFLDSSIIYLRDSLIEIEGLKIYGSPWQPWFYSWAFNLHRGENIREKWKLIPEGVDILITHGPPFGLGDLTVGGEKTGCKDLLDEILKRVKPKYHVFGHIHEGYGEYSKNEIRFVNASMLNERYEPTNQAVVLDM